MTTRKLFAALLGFVTGVITWPLAAITWPFVCAWYLYNEEDEV